MQKQFVCLLLAGMMFHPVMGADLGGFTLEEESDGNTGPFRYIYDLSYTSPEGLDFEIRLAYETRVPEPFVNNWVIIFPEANKLNLFGGGDGIFHYTNADSPTFYIKTYEQTQAEIQDMMLIGLDKKYYRDIKKEAKKILRQSDLTRCEKRVMQVVVKFCNLALKNNLDRWIDNLNVMIYKMDHLMPITDTCRPEGE